MNDLIATRHATIAAGHRRLEASADSASERLHWQGEAERFEELSRTAEVDPAEARRRYRPTVAYVEPWPAAVAA